MSTENNLELLAKLDEKSARVRRAAIGWAWASVAAAAVVLGALVWAGSARLAEVRTQSAVEQENVSELKQQREKLEAEVKRLQPLVDNYLAIERQRSIEKARVTAAPEPSQRGRIFLQTVQADDRRYAEGKKAELEKAGFRVMGIENVERAAGLRNTEVRYYKKADAAEAQRIVDVLKTGDPSTTLVFLGLDHSAKVQARNYEVWFRAQPN